ncbi:hypothetical protein C8R43DRAFT_957023 [Mycena crocata]|nr:hypothetical protein C8R43DRAFT_957023 [Mycena crocata]
MHGVQLHVSKWRAGEMFTGMRMHRINNPVWWNSELPPPHFNPIEFPVAHIFGQVIGEYIGAHTRFIELASPSFEKPSNSAAIIADEFDLQLENLTTYQKQDGKVMLDGPSRMDDVHGPVLNVGGLDWVPGRLLGRVVILRVSVKHAADDGTQEIVADKVRIL